MAITLTLSVSSKANSNIDTEYNLSENIHFQNFTNKLIHFYQKAESTHSGKLFLKYFTNTISKVELDEFCGKMGYSSEKNMNELFKSIYNDKQLFYSDYKSLKDEHNLSEILKIEFTKVAVKSNYLLRGISPEECFISWIIGLAACQTVCSGDIDYDTCLWQCTTYMSGIAAACMLIAD